MIVESVIAENNGCRQIAGCATALCKCMYSLGVPEEMLTDEVRPYRLTCPNCGFQPVLYCSRNSVYKP